MTDSDASNLPARRVNSIAPSGLNGVNTLAELGNELANNHRIVTATGIGNAFTIMAKDLPKKLIDEIVALENDLKATYEKFANETRAIDAIKAIEEKSND